MFFHRGSICGKYRFGKNLDIYGFWDSFFYRLPAIYMNSDLEEVHYFNSVKERSRTWTRLCYPGWTTMETAVLLYWASPTIKTRWSCMCSNHSITFSKYKLTGCLETPHTLLRVLLICSASLSLAMVLQKWAKWMLLPALPIKISQHFSITMPRLQLLKRNFNYWIWSSLCRAYAS